MSTTGKKSKKSNKKGTKLALSAFLGTNSVPEGFDKKVVNWADAMEDDDLNELPVPKFKDELKEVILPTAPKASRPNEIDTSRVPTVPPFKAYIGNIPYGAGEEDLRKFFENSNPISVQLPRDDKGTGRPRGFGYVEFETREGLIEALKKNSSYLNDRPLKVSLPEEGTGRDGDRRDRGPGPMMGDEDRTAGDWRKAPRSEMTSQQPYSAPRPDNSREMAGPWRSSSNQMTSDRGMRGRNGYDNAPYRSFEPPSSGYRDRYERPRGSIDDRRPMGGAFSDRRQGGGFDNYTRPPPDDRRLRDDRNYDNYGRDSYRDAPRPPVSRYDNDNERRYDRSDNRSDRGSDYDRFERTGGSDTRSIRSDDYRSEAPAPPADQQAAEAPKTRPKLQLKPRSKPLDEIGAPVASRNIFGEAKPVETAKKEQEVEEKLKSLDLK